VSSGYRASPAAEAGGIVMLGQQVQSSRLAFLKGSQVAAETAESAEISEHNLRADVSAVSAVSAAHKRGLTCQRRTGLPPFGPDGFAASRRNQPDLVSASTRLSV